MFKGEEIKLTIKPAFRFDESDVLISENGRDVSFNIVDGEIKVCDNLSHTGEHTHQITVSGVETSCRILVQDSFEEMLERRCRFIAEKQQYHKNNRHLDGAYLTYDNEEHHVVYSKEYDRNGGRERVGMGVLIARYLQTHENETLEKSLEKYADYVKRELFDDETGVVYNDYNRNNIWNRLYNYPWVSLFFIELYKLYDEKSYLVSAYKAMKSFYQHGGDHFYAIGIPAVYIVRCLEEKGMTSEREELVAFFRQHSEYIISNGRNYPAHEVRYEQSIVAPAAWILLQTYEITKEERYLTEAKMQMDVLELFSGLQPDYHLYEVAIRHWDGHWFGKRRMYGDTFPHYWSALTANVYDHYAFLTGDETYRRKAESGFRGVMSMFMLDGSASCAYVYPVTVNGKDGEFYDPYANDQDWGMYYMLRHKQLRQHINEKNA